MELKDVKLISKKGKDEVEMPLAEDVKAALCTIASVFNSNDGETATGTVVLGTIEKVKEKVKNPDGKTVEIESKKPGKDIVIDIVASAAKGAKAAAKE